MSLTSTFSPAARTAGRDREADHLRVVTSQRTSSMPVCDMTNPPVTRRAKAENQIVAPPRPTHGSASRTSLANTHQPLDQPVGARLDCEPDFDRFATTGTDSNLESNRTSREPAAGVLPLRSGNFPARFQRPPTRPHAPARRHRNGRPVPAEESTVPPNITTTSDADRRAVTR